MFFRILLPVTLITFFLFGCTPKVAEDLQKTEEAVTEKPVTPKPDKKLSPCPKFTDAPNPDEAETNYVLYRDFLRAKDWDQAFDYWQKVYEVAPAADGERNTLLADGIRFYEHFIRQSTDEDKKQEYIDEIFTLYDKIDECYPQGGFIAGRKAFDYYYKYPELKTKEEIYAMFKASIDTDGEKTNDFVINPFTSLLVQLYFDEKISMEEAQTYQQKVRDILAYGLRECEGVGCDRWKIVESYAPVRLEAFETAKGFYDCDYYMDKFYPDFEAAPTDCDVIRTVFSRLNWGGCSKDDERFKAIIRAGNENCVEASNLKLAYDALRNGEYNKSIELFEKAAGEEEDNAQKAKIKLTVAKVYYSHLRNFSKARQYARESANFNPNVGEPYLLIGRLYASSGPLCGPGTGWDSQIVVWPAIDKWQQAKRVDPSAAAEANRLIGTYRQYMPKKEDIFQRSLKAGSSFRVNCWIQENTTIRTAD